MHEVAIVWLHPVVLLLSSWLKAMPGNGGFALNKKSLLEVTSIPEVMYIH